MKSSKSRTHPTLPSYKWIDIKSLPRGEYTVDLLTKEWSAAIDNYTFRRHIDVNLTNYNNPDNIVKHYASEHNLRVVAFMLTDDFHDPSAEIEIVEF